MTDLKKKKKRYDMTELKTILVRNFRFRQVKRKTLRHDKSENNTCRKLSFSPSVNPIGFKYIKLLAKTKVSDKYCFQFCHVITFFFVSMSVCMYVCMFFFMSVRSITREGLIRFGRNFGW